ncbi:MAG: hypothetical protein ACPH5G_07605 [Pseudooceanicola atlanticus]
MAQGLDVTLYTYGDVPNAPPEVRVEDATPILDRSLLDRLQLKKQAANRPFQPVANFSDFFRIMLLKHDRGLWLDSDVFVFRSFEYDPTGVFFGKEDALRIGSPVFYLPPDHPIIGEYDALMTQSELMPNWLGFKRGVLRPWLWRMRGIEFTPPDIGITIYGNDAFTRLARRYSIYDRALPKARFYHWTGRKTDQLFDGTDWTFLRDNPKHLGIHVHRKFWENEPTQPGSWWEWAQDTYG